MTEKELATAYSLKQKKDKAFNDWQDLIILKDEHSLKPEKELSLSKISHGWVSVHFDDKVEVFDLLLKKAKARYDEAVEVFKNYQPQNSI